MILSCNSSINRLISLTFTLFAILTFLPDSYSQEKVEYLEPGYYAVVGAFGVKKNAVSYSKTVSGMGENAKYAFYPPRGLIYVQIGKYESYNKARVHALAARKNSKLDSTWVFKALPFTLENGVVIGGEVEMDQGIGIEYKIKRDTANIISVEEDGMAGQNGIKKGDQLTKIENEIIAGISLSKKDIDERLLGVGGSEILITVMRNGIELEHRLIRGEIGHLVEEGHLDFINRNDTVFIVGISEKAPPSFQVLNTGDKILYINGVPISGVGVSNNTVISALNNEKEEFTVTVLRNGEEKEFSLIRNEVGNLVEEGELNFIIENDTVYIVSISDFAPSDYHYLKPGDKILKIDDVLVSGVGADNSWVTFRLNSDKEDINLKLLRDNIPYEYTIEKNYADNSGIGIEFDIREGSAFITRVVKGSPAEDVGIEVGDEIIMINKISVSVQNMAYDELNTELNGPVGSFIVLTTLRDSVENTYTIERRPSAIDSNGDDDNNKIISADKLNLGHDLEGKKMYFYSHRVGTENEIPGKIEVVNPDHARRFGYKDTHQVINIPESISRSGNVSLICEIFGYKKIQHDFNIMDPMSERSKPFLKYEDDILVVDFELHRLTAGDLVTMYNVYFFKDAAIFRPESKYELKQLLDMLNESEGYRIRVFGHTNGNNAGPIIELEAGSTDYFSRQAKTIKGKGSAKKLSEKRAEVIKNYLITSGVSSNRIESKGFGGKKSIYGKFDPLAYKNVRVEIQIVAHK